MKVVLKTQAKYSSIFNQAVDIDEAYCEPLTLFHTKGDLRTEL